MEQNGILLLSDLESVYPSLFDLFNQNFIVVGEKNYARIALGSSNNTFSLVNDNFKCIVLVDQNVLDDEDKPFLNRFEKHIISFEYLLKEDMPNIASEIFEIIENLTKMFLPDEEKFELNYNIKNLLINCEKEEIYGIIYSRYCEFQNKEQRKAKRQELQDFVFQNISLILPQDIILYLNYSGFKQKFNNIYAQIIEYYKEGEHRNIIAFLKSMKYIKNIIYTFSSIEEPLLSNKEIIIDTKMFGKINKENVTEIMISSLISENQLEEELENFYFNPVKKIFVLKFNPDETDIMNYIKFFIENQINIKNNYNYNINQKAFIFSIHLNRIFNKDLKDIQKTKYIERNTLGELISHLSDFYQIFIDNLNGGNNSLLNLMECKEEELFEKCLDLEKIFITGIYKAFSYLNYNFNINIPYLNENNYSKYLMKYLTEEKKLSQKIINCILKQHIKEKDIFFEILKKNYIEYKDVDIIDGVKRYLSELFTNNLTQFVFKSEEEHFFSTFIYNKIFFYKEIDFEIINEENNIIKKNSIFDDISDDEIEEELILYPEDNEILVNPFENNLKNKENDLPIYIKDEKDYNNINIKKEEKYFLGNKVIEKLIDFYFEIFDISSTKKLSKIIKNNNIEILQGLRLPGIKKVLENTRNYIKTELKNKYLETENNIRILNKEEKENYLQNYKNKLKNYVSNLETEFIGKDLFKFLNKIDEKYLNDLKQFAELLLDDYLLLFLSDSSQDIKNDYYQLDNYKEFLKKCIDLRLGNSIENDPIETFCMKILWLESNKTYIDILLDIYKKLLINEEDLFSKIKDILNNNEIIYEIDRSPEFTEEFNSPFFFMIESLLKITISDYEMYKKIKQKDLHKFMISLKVILQNAFNIQNNINSLYSKEIFTLEEFLNIYEKLNSVNKCTKENILNVLQLLSEQSKFINNLMKDIKDGEDLCNIDKLYDFLIDKLGNTDSFAELMLNIFVDEVKKIKNIEYRKKLTEIILKNQKLIKNSYPFFYIIISGEISEEIDYIQDNLNNLENNFNYNIQLINEANNEVLNQIVLSIFENIFNIYFNSIPNLDDETLSNMFNTYYNNKENLSFTLLDFSLNLFRNYLNYLEDIFNNNNKKENIKQNQLICSLYCIAFIKIYLYKAIYYLNYYNQQFIHSNRIIDAIKGNANNKFRNIIKIYVFKIFFYLNNRYYYNINNIDFLNKGITFYEDIKDLWDENKESMLNYYFIPIGDKYQEYCSLYELFEKDRLNNFSDPIENFKKEIEEFGIDNYFAVSSNIIISMLGMNKYFNSEEYKNYSSFAKHLFEKKLDISINIKKLILLFSNEEDFNKIMKPKLIEKDNEEEKEQKKELEKEQNKEEIIINEKISQKLLEILLYSLRICIQTVNNNNNENNLYYKILSSSQYKEIINSNCIPGNTLLNNIYVKNFIKIENHLMTQPSDRGIYVCSCGLSYIIESCGFPSPPENGEKELLCKNCKEKIGYGKPPPDSKNKVYGMILRKGHYRIFKDEKQKYHEMNLYNNNDKNIQNILLENYKKEIIEPKLEEYKFGINLIPQVNYKDPNLKVRNLSEIGFRLLNFILYSHLFFSNCLGYISDDELKKNYLCDGMTCIDMIEINWDLLKDNLQSKYGIVIQIFMNLIFEDLSELIKNCKLIKTNKERENFENEIEKLINKIIENYENNSKTYLEVNIEQLQLNKDNMKSLVLENFDVDLYKENLYPFYKYFLMTTYPSEKKLLLELQKIPEYEKKYPILTAYLEIIQGKIKGEDNIIRDENYYLPQKEELIKYLPEFNEFSNLMIDIYSYKISRKEASKIKLNTEEIYEYNKGGFKDSCDKFINIWKKIGPYAVKYEDQILNEKILKSDMTLDYFLNDIEVKDNVKGNGMYIASAYQNFIDWQNNFLNKLIEPLRNNPFLNHFLKNIEKKIDVQKAKKVNVLNFSTVKESFSEKIFENCKRDIFIDDQKINYINYTKLIFDFDSIENYLGIELLVNKTRFNDYKKLKFVTYCYEGFKENKNSIFVEFEKFYEQKTLDLNSKQKIYDNIIEMIQQKDDYSKILLSITLLLYHLTQEIKNPKDEINVILKDLPFYVNISDEAKTFFQKFEFKVEELIGINSLIEIITFEPMQKYLKEEYKEILDNKTIDEIKGYFSQSKFSVIKRYDLCSACRKIILRYLINISDEIDGNEKNSLEIYLNREELWKKEIWQKNELLKKDLDIIKELKITIGQCYELYSALKEKVDIELIGVILNKEIEEENKKLLNLSESKIIKKKYNTRKKY